MVDPLIIPHFFIGSCRNGLSFGAMAPAPQELEAAATNATPERLPSSSPRWAPTSFRAMRSSTITASSGRWDSSRRAWYKKNDSIVCQPFNRFFYHAGMVLC